MARMADVKGSPANSDRPRAIALIRAAPLHDLAQADKIETLLLNLGLNDEGIDEFPAVLHPFCGSGLRIWQYPSQFSKYLLQLSGLHVRSYPRDRRSPWWVLCSDR